jgi:hypothetical protein
MQMTEHWRTHTRRDALGLLVAAGSHPASDTNPEEMAAPADRFERNLDVGDPFEMRNRDEPVHASMPNGEPGNVPNDPLDRRTSLTQVILAVTSS